MHKLLLFSLYILCIYLFPINSLHAQELDINLYVGGEISAIIKNENNIYLGGSFSYIGSNTGNGAILNLSDGSIAHKGIALVDGDVHSVVPDQKGGWFIGGDFTKVQGIDRAYLAHILPNGNLDISWNPIITHYSPTDYNIVNSIVLIDNILYVGGTALSINGVQPDGLIALSSVTAELLPMPKFDSYVYTLYHIDNLLYIGGSFSTTIDGKTRENIAALDLSTKQFTDWNPTVSSTIHKLVASKSTVCIKGYFSTVNGQSCPKFAALDASSSQLLNWSINLPVAAMDIDKNILYIGGFLPNSNIVGKIRKNLASIDLNTGQATDWNPDFMKMSGINFLKFANGKLYVGTGSNHTNEGDMLYSIDTTNNSVKLWQSIAEHGPIYALAIWNDEIYAGGGFESIGGTRRNSLACLDAYSGRLLPWHPKTNGQVNTMAINGDEIYLGGEFTAINNLERKYLASVSIATGETTNWNPTASYYINKLIIIKNTIYVGGNFIKINGQDRKYLAAIDASSGQITPWNPIASAYVNDIIHANNKIYIGGNFLQINGQKRNYLAAVDPISGTLATWNPIAESKTHCITAFEDKIYIGGEFKSMNGQKRIYAAAVNAFSGAITNWNPNLGALANDVSYDKVQAITIADNQVYLCGYFDKVGGKNRTSLASVDINIGKVTDWNPLSTAHRQIKAIVVEQGVIYTGGANAFPSFATYGKLINPPNYIKGKVFNDKDKDCVKNGTEEVLRNTVIVAEPGPYYALSDDKGNYSIAVDTGTYIIKQILPLNSKAKLIRQVCPTNNEGYTINFSTYNNVADNISFANEVINCPQLKVEIASDRRRRCFRSITTVNYSNEGLAFANDVKVHVKFPQYVVPISANIAWEMEDDSTYVFDIGHLPASQSGTISITDSVICGIPAIRGLIQCTKAWITPENTCIPPDPLWDKSDIHLKAKCLNNGLVNFSVNNLGIGAMSDSSSFRIYTDAKLVFEHRYKLQPGDSLLLQIPANGKTIRLEADQHPNHPKKQRNVITIEACGTNAAGKVSTGFVTQLPMYNEVPEEDIECLPIIDSYDPNDKTVIPTGTTAHLYTPTGTSLEYTIRFQNTGSDYAYKVIVVDTLSSHLDIASLKIKAVSHPYTFSISGKGKPVLTFTFSNINLPDSNRNEVESHGYIKFSIAPSTAITQGTVIDNYADIFFDYNPAVRTNTIFNTIYDIPVSLPENSNEGKILICQSAIIAHGGPNRNFCEQDTVVLQASHPTFGIGKWRILKGGGTIKEINNPTSIITNLTYGENMFEWKVSANTCSTDSTASTVKIIRYKSPVVTVTAIDTSCGQGNVTLKASGSSIGEYKWYSAQDTSMVIAKESIFITPSLSSSTTYYVAAIEQGCESTKIPVAAIVEQVPVIPIITQLADSLYCSTIGISYEWYVNNKLIEMNSQRIYANENGKYTVKVISDNCSSALSEPYTYERVTTGIEEQDLQIRIYPNPTTGSVFIQLMKGNKAQVSLQDGMGRSLLKTNIISNREATALSLQGIKPGLYILIIETDKQFLLRKLIVK